MFWFRSFALGLLGACCLLLAMRPPISVVTTGAGQIIVVSAPTPPVLQCAATPPPVATDPDITVVDVAPGVTAAMLAQMIVLAANERITAIDDIAVSDGFAALTNLELRTRRYIDIAIADHAGRGRRVAVLLH